MNIINIKELHEKLTMIITTSAVVVNPSTLFIEKTMRSYMIHEPAMFKCKKIIVCDKEVIAGNGTKIRPKYGVVPEDVSSRYDEFKERLGQLVIEGESDEQHTFFNTKLLILERKHGFALAVRHALTYVTTPYVMVVQHDRPSCKPFAVEQIVQSMDTYRFSKVNYICLGTKSTFSYGNRPLHYAPNSIDVRDHAIDIPGTKFFIVPLTFWFDSTHICRTAFYHDFALQRQRMGDKEISSQWGWRMGDFIEDKLGHLVRHTAKNEGMAGLLKYGTYFLCTYNDGVMNFQICKGVSKESQEYYLEKYGVGPIRENEDEGSSEKTDVHKIVVHLNQRKILSLAGHFNLEVDENYQFLGLDE